MHLELQEATEAPHTVLMLLVLLAITEATRGVLMHSGLLEAVMALAVALTHLA